MEVDIIDISSKGLGVSRAKGKVVFVEWALVNETVSCTPVREGTTIIEARLDKILKPSSDRVEPVCPHFKSCGGCQLQHLSYSGQLKMKQKKIQDALERIGKIKGVRVEEVIGSVEYGYRNKLQMPVRAGKLGFFGSNSHEFVPIQHCYLHLPQSQKVLEEIESMGIPHSIDTLVMKTAFSTNSVLMILCSFEPLTAQIETFAKAVIESKKEVKGIYFTRRKKDSNFVFGKDFTLVAGQESIEDEILGLKFSLYKDAFYQVNPYQVPHLYRYAIDRLELKETDRFLDAFCGVGTMTLLASKSCKEAVGIECVPSAIESAINNRDLNKIQNVQFYLGRAEERIKELPPFNKVILNPPRKGCDENLLNVLKEQKVEKIVYVSCDPATFARDIKILQSDYVLKSVQPFDLFPQTVHVETVGYLELR
jgi:23S rRNA (uracil1939-C5)-methyltransferase